MHSVLPTPLAVTYPRSQRLQLLLLGKGWTCPAGQGTHAGRPLEGVIFPGLQVTHTVLLLLKEPPGQLVQTEEAWEEATLPMGQDWHCWEML